MPQFEFNQSISTETSTIEVEVSPEKPLKPGRYQFSLVVVDDSGNESAPDTVDVFVIDDQAPTAILSAPRQVSFGRAFTLDGSRSVDAGGGQIVKYVWTLVDAS